VNELAKRAGMSAGRVHGILTGATPNPGVLTVQKVLAALGKSLAWLERKTRKRGE
jgi:transcriptional regulator with XRE-family HTH domain